MIALSEQAPCPNCKDVTTRKKVCWACSNRRLVEAGRVCRGCGNWHSCCTCPIERIVSIEKRRPGQPSVAPPITISVPQPIALSEKTKGGGGFRGDPEPTTTEPPVIAEDDRSGLTITPDPPGQTEIRSCWLGVTPATCGLTLLFNEFYLCRRCGYFRQQR